MSETGQGLPAVRPAVRRASFMMGGQPKSTPAAPSTAEAEAGGRDDGPWLLVLDVETLPDETLATPPAVDPAAMPKPMYHRVAALAFLRARITTADGSERLVVEECRAGGRDDTTEADLLTGFWRSFEAWKPKLVTFNGRGFALPVLKYRSMRHKLTARHLHEAGDRWSGYGNRYNLSHHVDLMDVLSDHHASPFPSLADIGRGLDLPHRAEDAPPGDVNAARRAAESDVVTIFLAYLRWRLFTGQMSQAAHDDAIASLRAHVGAGADVPPHLGGLLGLG